jgi:hypothetical protein
VENFTKFYDNYFIYRRTFEFVYAFLTKDLRPSYISPFARGSSSLKKLFLSRIPNGIGERIIANISARRLDRVTCIEDLMTLLDSRVGNLREFSRRVEEANQILLGSDYDVYHGKYREHEVDKAARFGGRNRVNAIEDDTVQEEVQYYEKEYRGKVQRYTEEDSEVEDEDEQVAVIKAQARVMNPKLVDDKRDRPYIPNPVRSGNVQPTRPPMFEKFPNVCYYKWFTGSCKDPNCNYHGKDYEGKEEEMYKAMVEYMKTHYAKPKGYKLILVKGEQGQVKPTPNRPQFPKKMNALEDEECEDENVSGDYPVGEELEISTSRH